jgi:hypothetical protein
MKRLTIPGPLVLPLLSGATMLLLAGGAAAHHSKAMFDNEKCANIEGTVRTFEWVYPHSWLWVVVRNSEGKDDVWGFESMSPSQLYGVDHRWTRDSVKKGDKVNVKYSPLKDGRNGGSMNSVTLPGGQVFLGSPDACSGAAGNPVSPGDFNSPPRQ